MDIVAIMDAARYAALAETGQAALHQRAEYGVAAASLGADVLRLELRDGSTVVGFVQVLRRRIAGLPVALATRGPIWIGAPEEERRRAALRALRKGMRGLVLVTLDGEDTAMRRTGFARVMTPATVASLSLDGDARARMHGKWRNRLRHAESSSLAIRESPLARLGWLLDADAHAQRVKGYRALPRAFVEAWTGGALGLVASDRGEDVAAMLFFRHGSTATYHIGWSGEAGRRASAHNLLLWRAMEVLRESGVRTLDLGTLDTVNAPGLARFKLGAGAAPHRLGGTWLGW